MRILIPFKYKLAPTTFNAKKKIYYRMAGENGNILWPRGTILMGKAIDES